MNAICMNNTSNYAKNRLMNILISDRIGCTPEIISELKNSISRTLNSYLDIEPSGIDIQINERILLATVPISNIYKKKDNEKCESNGNRREEIQTD
ncbi:MAG: cell division topological specificity factor MinE [Coprococcus sp.]